MYGICRIATEKRTQARVHQCLTCPFRQLLICFDNFLPHLRRILITMRSDIIEIEHHAVWLHLSTNFTKYAVLAGDRLGTEIIDDQIKRSPGNLESTWSIRNLDAVYGYLGVRFAREY